MSTSRLRRLCGLHGIALTLLVASTAAAQSAGLPAPEAVAARVDSLIRSRLQDPMGPASIAVMIVRGADTLVHRAWGTAVATTGRAATEAMTYRVGSLSKQFTAALLLRLVDGGRLSLDDSLGHHLRGLRPEWRPLTIEQLLNHTSGMQREYRHHVPPDRRAVGVPGDTLLVWAARDTMDFAPGTAWAYSNTGYMILGHLVEKLYGRPYADVVREEIARPLGLPTLGWCTAPEKRATETKGHQRTPDGALRPAPDISPDLALGAGGLCASVGDLTGWNLALHGGRVLSGSMYQGMTTPRGAAVGEGYGFGLESRPTPWGTRVLAHEGSTPGGFLSETGFFPAESLSIVVLYNSARTRGMTPLVPLLASIALGRDTGGAPAGGGGR